MKTHGSNQESNDYNILPLLVEVPDVNCHFILPSHAQFSLWVIQYLSYCSIYYFLSIIFYQLIVLFPAKIWYPALAFINHRSYILNRSIFIEYILKSKFEMNGIPIIFVVVLLIRPKSFISINPVIHVLFCVYQCQNETTRSFKF